MPYYILAIFLTLGSFFLQAKVTAVTTYVTTVQDERESTRWTLTKWLEIKERMKLMDVWLAMFSDPQKDKFSPELMLSYGKMKGSLSYVSDSTSEKTAKTDNQAARAQLWLTNIISSTVGVRTLNVDFGAEIYTKQTSTLPSDYAELNAQTSRVQSYTANLRIFGKNVQDSSIVLKYGGYQAKYPWMNIEEKGEAVGGELQLYIFKWLGAEANYMKYGKNSGNYFDYQGYIEISLLRISAGPYNEEWTTSQENVQTKSTERGIMANIKLSL